MTTGGWVMMSGSIGLVLCLVGYCLSRILLNGRKKAGAD